MKVHVIGFYDRANVGDEAFRPVLEDFFVGHDIEVFNIDDYRVQTPAQPDLLVLGGGDVVNPYYLELLSSLSCRKVAVGVGLGYESECELAGEAGFQAWFLRNKSDVKLVRGKTKAVVEYMPDLAYWYAPGGRSVLSRYYTGKKPVVGLFLTDYLMPAINRDEDLFWNRSRRFLQHFAKFCKWLKESGFHILAVPCSTDRHADDRRVHMSLRSLAQDEFTLVTDQLTPQETIDLIQEMKYTVCQRFHAHVFSMIAGTPFLSVGFTRKVNKLIDAAGAGVNAESFVDNDYVERDLDSLFVKMQKEADTACARFLKFSSDNRIALGGIKQKVLQCSGLEYV